MPNPDSLRREEAVERSRTLSVTSYDIALDLTAGDQVFRSVTTIRFDCAHPASTFVEVRPRALRSATLNGRPLDRTALVDGRLWVDCQAGYNELLVDADMAYSHDGEGLHRHVDPADGNAYLYATSALAAAPRWFACFDQPDLKAAITLSVRCPPEWTVIANGAATRVAPGEWTCATTRPMSTYIATVVAGPYRSVSGSHDGIPIAVHARTSLALHLAREAPELLKLTADCLDEFHRLFGIRYPWGEYHHVFVPEFNWGAMENPGCVTYRDEMIFRSRATDAERASRASTVAHEMAHMWFGDLVTMRWWDDLWLNESFAEYLGHRVCDAVTDHASWVDFGVVRKAWGYRADRRPSTHPVAGSGAADVASALNDFDGISYAKGASVLRQLAAHLGDDVFLGGLRRHFDTHAYGNAEFADLIGAWTSAGAVDLGDWAQRWLRTSGLDTLTAVHADGGVRVLRYTPAGPPTGRPHSIAVAAYDSGGRELSRTAVSVDGDGTLAAGLSTGAALLLPDADDQTWAKIALDAGTWDSMSSLVAALPTSARVVVCNALRLAVADAELDPAHAAEIVAAVLASETDEAIITAMSGWANRVLLGTYLRAGPARDDATDRLATALTALLADSEPSSGRQLAAARAYIAVGPDVDQLRRWLGGEVPTGIELDAELRWSLLNRLAGLGEVSTAGIDAELARDNSAQGAVHAARCRAARPDPQAKTDAWQALMTDPDRSNYELYGLAEGFWHPAQTDLTTPYAERYFAEIASTARLRSGMVVSRVALLSYPWTAVTPATVAATDTLLAAPELDEQIRRSVVDCGDDLRRAVNSRARFTTLAQL